MGYKDVEFGGYGVWCLMDWGGPGVEDSGLEDYSFTLLLDLIVDILIV